MTTNSDGGTQVILTVFGRPKLRAVVAAAFAALSSVLVGAVVAQSDNNLWQPAANVSRSGAASQPVVAAAPDGTLHAMWWDATEGELYAQSTAGEAAVWTQPSSVPAIVGARTLDQLTRRETLTPPRDVRLISNSRGDIFALWIDTTDQLRSVQLTAAGWSNATTLAEAAVTLDVKAGIDEDLHLAYIRPLNSPAAPAGIYYRTAQGASWSNPSLVYASDYLRTVKPEDANISAAGDGQGQVLVAWDEPQTGQSLFARSGDNGATWGEPQVIASTQGSRAQHTLVAFAPDDEFLQLWQDPGTGDCGFFQRRSADGGQTWGEPERVLSTISRCDARWSFMPSEDGRLWLVGRSDGGSQTSGSGGVTIAVWDGRTWSDPKDVALSFFDSRANRAISLNCLDIAIAGQTAALTGCDPAGDVWATRNAIELNALIPSITTVWSPIKTLSTQTGLATTSDTPDLATDERGRMFAAWSQSDSPGKYGTAIYAAAWNNGQWSTAARVNRQDLDAAASSPAAVGKAEQPAIAAGQNDRVHVVWSGESDGTVLYSWAYARDVDSTQGWSESVALSAPDAAGRWPDIAAHPRSDELYVIYAVPFNEKRGIYLAHSADGGTTWISRTAVWDAAAAQWDSVDKPRLALDANRNILHAVWLRTVLPDTIGSQAIYYARSIDNGRTWNTPTIVAEGAVDWPRVAVPAAGQVYLAWNQSASRGAAGTSLWGQYSPDGGERWSAPAAVRGFDRIGGPIGLTGVDGNGQMYLAGLGANAGNESALVSAKWNGQSWDEIETVGLNQLAAPGNSVAIAAAPQVSRLGALLYLWKLKPDGSGQFEIVGSDRPIAVAVPSSPAPTFTPLPTASPASNAAVPAATPTPRPQLSGNEQKPPAESQAPQPLVIGGVLAVVIVAIVVTRTIWSRRQ